MTKKMETFRLRRSNATATAATHSSSRRFNRGNGWVQKQRNFPNLAFDSSSASSDATNRDSFMGEFGRRSSKQGVGTPIKQLLAEEMMRETESKRRSPSVIARLMGLDVLPSQQNPHKQQKSENYRSRIVPTENTRRNFTSCSRQSSRRGSKEEQEFKDVFEVFDTSKTGNSGCSLQGIENSRLSKNELAVIQQKFMDAKCLSTDKKFQDSKEFRDTIEDLDSNKDLLLKFLQQPDSLFTKHLNDLDNARPKPSCGHKTTMKSLHGPGFERGRLGCKIEQEIPWKNQKSVCDDLVSGSYNVHATHNSLKLSEVQFEGKDESTVPPTRIVVLKPNIGKMQNVTKSASSPRSSLDSLSDHGNCAELPSNRNRGSELCGKKRFPSEVGFSRHKSRESREIAKEITRQMRESFTGGSMNFSTSGFREYAGDESSPNRSENESTNESDITTITSRKSVDKGKQYGPLLSCSTDSSVSREARKRLSERWKMTHKSVDMGMVSRGSTLGEMLASVDREVRPAVSDNLIGEKLDNKDGLAVWVEPLGISSRDGWKDGCTKSLSRSRSLPASSTAIGSPKMGLRHESFFNDKYMMPKEVMQRASNKAVSGNFNRGEGSPSKNSRSHSKRSHKSHYSYSADHGASSPEVHLCWNQVQSCLTEHTPYEHSHMAPAQTPYEQSHMAPAWIPYEQSHRAPGTSAGNVMETSLLPKNVVNVVIEDMTVLAKGNSSTSYLDVLGKQEPSNGQHDQDCISMQQSIAEQESSASSKEADQPSPVSVLETPFPDDPSSGSECFESLNADLHGLRMQLQLLKLESEAYAEGSMLVSSDKDDEEGTIRLSKETGIAEESREISYTFDVLAGSGINDPDADAIVKTWQCPECPLNPLIFNELEKKYSNYASWLSSERRLLFDRINSALLLIYQKLADPHPWVRSAAAIAPRWKRNGLVDGLLKFLTNEDKKASNNAAEVLVRESLWLDWRDDIDVIGREIERLLTEELVEELVEM